MDHSKGAVLLIGAVAILALLLLGYLAGSGTNMVGSAALPEGLSPKEVVAENYFGYIVDGGKAMILKPGTTTMQTSPSSFLLERNGKLEPGGCKCGSVCPLNGCTQGCALWKGNVVVACNGQCETYDHPSAPTRFCSSCGIAMG